MTTPLQPWPRELHPESRDDVAVHLFVFAPRELDLGAPLSSAEHGVPEGFDADAIEVAYLDRGTHAQWVEGFFDPSVEALARREIGEAFEDVKRSQGVYALSFVAEEPDTLGYLQTIWAFARYLASLGASAVLDAATNRWWKAAELLARTPDRPFAIEDEVVVVVEDDGDGAPAYVHTRGLQKLGRPDVILEQVLPSHRARAVDLLQTLAAELARGATLRAGDAIALADGVECVFREYKPGERDPELGLGSATLVLAVPALARS